MHDIPTSSLPENKHLYECDGLVVDEIRMLVKLNEQEIVLTKKEFVLLLFLMKNEGKFFSREQIIEQV